MAVKKEEELYEPLKAYYEALGYQVRAEVKHCDLVAIHPETNHTLIVEIKKTFNLALLLQGVERLRLNTDVVLAVERNRKKSGSHNQRFGDLAELCRMLGLGLITVTVFKTKAPTIAVLAEPGEAPLRRMKHRKQQNILREFHERSGDYNVGGSTGRKLVTAYREKALQCAYVLQHLEEAAPRQIAAITKNPSTASILQHNYYQWFKRVRRGVYVLEPAGKQALIEYSYVVNELAASYEL
ncbi:DUF2161 family putative PD-(D/E)XK-type phosphodiesterase [Paenibacillus yanchengensis]|uniref:DUF2161 family putative PD-(D/E)XK-type phosphodiesterase n=1 Tax=Paenibacillus yanchengensis TaxID=2035833 RepID=A0ABW4YQ35_9BACL